MMRRNKYILIMLAIIATAGASAQNSQVLYFMNIPQNHLANPAFRPSNSVSIGLPVISGINLGVNNNFLNFSDVFLKRQSADSVFTFLHPYFKIGDFLSKIKDKNSINPQTTIQLFSLGFAIGQSGYLFFDLNEKFEANIVIPGDLFKLALSGNEQFAGSKIDLSSFRGDIKYYHEAGIGYSQNINNKLRLGVKAKVLLGIADASIDNRAFSIAVSNDYVHTLNADLRLNVSAPVKVIKDPDTGDITDVQFDDSQLKTGSQIASYIMNTRNLGFSLDLGAAYEVNDRLNLSAAVTDLGYIRWTRDVTNLVSKSSFEFSGFDMKEVIKGNKTFDEVSNKLVDSLKNSVKATDQNNPFTTYLPFGVTLGGSYSLTPNVSLGLMSYTRFIGKQIREAATLSANVNLGSALSASLCYTAENNRYDNVGAGLALRAGFFQFYLLADKIPIEWNKIIIDSKSSIPLPYDWHTLNLRLGMNVVFGNKVKKAVDRPMVDIR